MKYQSTKTYGNEIGLSCAFRQWKAVHSHCRLLHGYSLGFRFVFEADKLDERNWVVDFGALDDLKAALVDAFDHRVAVAQDDPALDALRELEDCDVVSLTVMETVGCEAFAAMALEIARELVEDDRVRVVSAECFEHGANSAIAIQ